jgi:hypothetical protein
VVEVGFDPLPPGRDGDSVLNRFAELILVHACGSARGVRKMLVDALIGQGEQNGSFGDPFSRPSGSSPASRFSLIASPRASGYRWTKVKRMISEAGGRGH